ncbi:MAG TPA: MBL fold metallo-hydrolase [Chthoniobacteraceae bacterium]|nr:MBL fold metallo-hydrolase [Chthoniobacteraceae bacterium]
MFFITVLGSGSAGNCALVETPKARLLIDAGLSARQTVERLARCCINPLEIDAIILTHEHSDHSNALEVWCKKFQTPIYCNSLTAAEIRHRAPTLQADFRLFLTGRPFEIKDLTIENFRVEHDAVDPLGFVLNHGTAALGFLTDLGFVTKLVRERIREVQTLVIETNYDEKLLNDDTKRPWPVKQRIKERHGHLSNSDAANVVGELPGGRLRRAVLGHLSRDCNSPELALGAVRARLDAEGAHGIEVLCATQREVTPRLAVAAA